MRDNDPTIHPELFSELDLGKMFIAYNLVWIKTSSTGAAELWNERNVCAFNLSPRDAIIIPISKESPNIAELLVSEETDPCIQRELLVSMMSKEDQVWMNTAEALNDFFVFELYEFYYDNNKRVIESDDITDYMTNKTLEIQRNFAGKPINMDIIDAFIDEVKQQLTSKNWHRDDFFEHFNRKRSVEFMCDLYANRDA